MQDRIVTFARNAFESAIVQAITDKLMKLPDRVFRPDNISYNTVADDPSQEVWVDTIEEIRLDGAFNLLVTDRSDYANGESDTDTCLFSELPTDEMIRIFNMLKL